MTANPPRPPGLWWRSILIAIGILVCACGSLSYFKTPTPEPQKVVANLTAPTNPSAPTPAQQAWIKDNVYAVLVAAANDYPVMSVRQSVAFALTKITKDKEIATHISLDTHRGDVGRVALSHWVDGQRHMTLIYPALRWVEQQCNGDRQQFEDFVIATLLHETFHLYEQAPYGDDLSLEKYLELEQEAWWWTMQYVIVPMRAHGRPARPIVTGQQMIELAYYQAKGDPRSPAWRSIVNTMYLRP